MNDGWLDFVQVLECMNNLHDDASCFTLGNAFVLLQIKVQIMTITVLQDGAKRIGVDLENIVQAHHARMIKLLVNIVLAQSVLDVVCLLVVLPVFVELMDFTSDVTLLLQVKGFVYFGEATCLNQEQEKISSGSIKKKANKQTYLCPEASTKDTCRSR